ncbi:hypothetical protein M413DRAFT_443473 [Hebeloma cylindrosporum]|uniref:Uncharacterized protein n=1 Tax=Hebeloma cylindrosporum TaxID=76867 RepID=A0A0C3CHA7_HEBCY|nr:hypothetical protein M413DRAFT_443473 [Hebeloma cylindrosporum h7]
MDGLVSCQLSAPRDHAEVGFLRCDDRVSLVDEGQRNLLCSHGHASSESSYFEEPPFFTEVL